MSTRFSVGEVVARREIPSSAPVSELEVVPAVQEQKAPATSVWSNKASLADQFTNEKWETTYRIGPPQVEVFELPAQQDAANKLLARSKPEGSPEIVVLQHEPMQSDNKLVLFVLYHLVEYSRILGDPTQNGV